MKKILHIVNDEKFIVDADELFNKVPNYHHNYAVIGKKKELKNLKSLDVFFIHPIMVVLGFNLSFLKNYDAIIFHGLKGFKFNLIKKIDRKVPIGWIGWGYDYYNLINSNRSDFLLPKTISLINKFPKKKKTSTKVFLKSFEPNIDTKLRALKRIKFFNTVVKEDHYILSKALGNCIPTYVDWNYPILKDTLINHYISKDFSPNNILVGNSGSITNNHLDAFERINSSAFSDYDKVICPLSYGGNKEYRNRVVKGGKEIFSEKFKPLEDFYEAKEYFKILNSCTYYFSPTLRQQAFGNILLMLYAGASIILFKENPVYRSLIEKNIIVFSEIDLDCGFLRKLSPEEIRSNRKIVMDNFSEKVLIFKSKEFLNALVRE